MTKPTDQGKTPPIRRYWSQRHGADGGRVSLPVACRLFRSLLASLSERGYFQEQIGFSCIDAGDVLGEAGPNPEGYALRKTRLEGVWPVTDAALDWDELHLMTAIEFAHDHISRPVAGDFHSYGGCGWHYETFDPAKGQEEFRHEVNSIIGDLGEGFELGVDGEIVRTAPSGLAALVEAPLPRQSGAITRETLDDAIRKFRTRSSSTSDRRDAVRDLAGVLELLRPKLKTVLMSPDERDLFNIANNFAIRHENGRQRRNYDPAIWLSWMFYFYLATIHAALRLIERQEHPDSNAPPSSRPD